MAQERWRRFRLAGGGAFVEKAGEFERETAARLEFHLPGARESGEFAVRCAAADRSRLGGDQRNGDTRLPRSHGAPSRFRCGSVSIHPDGPRFPCIRPAREEAADAGEASMLELPHPIAGQLHAPIEPDLKSWGQPDSAVGGGRSGATRGRSFGGRREGAERTLSTKPANAENPLQRPHECEGERAQQ